MNKWCLITGASTGIGKDLSNIFAINGYNLILVARNQEKLNKLKNELLAINTIKIETVSIDLSESNSAQKLKDIVDDFNINIHTLINNAGVGLAGEFNSLNYLKSQAMLNLNMITLSDLCHLFSSDMIKDKSGQILNVASTAAFQPGPYMTAYYASKSFVLNYTQGIRFELNRFNINVTCLCPGATKTDFFKNESFSNSKLSKIPFMSTSTDVANAAFKGLCSNKAVVVPGLLNKLTRLTSIFTPVFFSNSIVSKLNYTIIKK